MAPVQPRLKILSVGGNAVSAFLSWRLQATNSCDVTLVWKSGYEAVHQYGISFKGGINGVERFKPRHVVRSPEEAANNREGAFDYVILCVKALPDVYDLSAVIESVVTPQHTCILINTTHTLGVESLIEERFPTNVVLSLVSNAEITQLGASEFEHKGSSEIWVGAANQNGQIPAAIQDDMAQALAMTLSTGNVDCKVSPNIRQQQFERVTGPIAFHPASVVFENNSHSALMEMPNVRDLVNGVIDELVALARAQGCKLDDEFKGKVIKEQCQPAAEDASIMWQDFVARRPMEVETYLGSPLKLAKSLGISLPRIETLYAVLHHKNIVNQTRPKDTNGLAPVPGSPTGSIALRLPNGPPRGGPNGMANGNGMTRRPRGATSNYGPPPGMRRGPPPGMNGGPPNAYRPPPPGMPNGHSSRQPSRRGSLEELDPIDYSHIAAFNDDVPLGAEAGYPGDNPELVIREREMQLRQRERDLAMREQSMRARGGRGGAPPPRRAPPPRNGGGMYDDEDEEDDYFDPNAAPMQPMVDPDNFDMMSVTSRKNRTKPPSQRDMRRDVDNNGMSVGGPPSAARNSRSWGGRPGLGRNRSSQIIDSMPPLHANPLDDPMLSATSNRFGNVDRAQMHQGSRSNSLTAAALNAMHGQGGMSGPYPNARRASHSPADGYAAASVRGLQGRPSPPGMNGRPSPPETMRQPVPRYPPGHGNSVTPHQVETRVGVSLQPPSAKNEPSLTGSASASAGSGDSARVGSEPSAHSSQSSLGRRPPVGVR